MASAVVGLNESVKWQLIRLVNGDSKPSEDLDSKVMKGEAISSNYCTPEDETDDANQDFHLNKDREKAFPVRDESLDSSSDEFNYPYIYRTSESRMIKIKNIKENISMEPESPSNFNPIGLAAESNTPAVTPDKYICSTCRVSFLTPQALGGHRSNHKKFKVKVYNTIDDQSSIGASYTKNVSKANAIKQLEALGVQNQCHCTGECNHADHVTSIDEAKKERKVHEFDLNVTLDEDGEKGRELDNTTKGESRTSTQLERLLIVGH
ncbi:zinc finger protein ZAT9-like [Olea europaea var. sylvestris]|uniref:zinc finger protein ZAT9-like n=1 Tax=Olea europaea var. sylvestris TaxID=158386 RepID=UPI000C1D5E73|nr:zinc finger protein ZAT9-like [Olea europaea var. sylvestris]